MTRLTLSLSALQGRSNPRATLLPLLPRSLRCVPYVSANYYYYFYLYFTFVVVPVVVAAASTLNISCLYVALVVSSRLSTLNPQILCVCVSVCVCAGGSSCYGHVHSPPLPPLAYAIAALNKHKLRCPRIAVMRRVSISLSPSRSGKHLSLACKAAVFFIFLFFVSFTFLFFAQLKCLSNYLDVFPPASCVNCLTLSSERDRKKARRKNDLIYR